jgi:hypothetical protein
MTYKISAMMFVLSGMLAMVTAVVTLEQTQSEVGGSAAAFQSLANVSANPDNVSINQGTVGGPDSPVDGVWEFVKQGAGWVTFMASAMMLQSPIWEGWTQPIRYGIMLISIPFLFLVTVTIGSAATNFLGGIFGRVTP